MPFVEKDENGAIVSTFARPQYEGQEFVENAELAKTWNHIRSERAPLLGEADFKINSLEDQGKSSKSWRTYRQKLRDITDAHDSPEKVKWPKKPTS